MNFAVVGLEHLHALAMTATLQSAGAQLIGFQSDNDAAATTFHDLFGPVERFDHEALLVGASTVDLVVLAGVPADRAATAVAAMEAGKDVLSDKPAVTTFQQLEDVRHAQQATGRMFSVYFSERLESRATQRASTMVAEGAIGSLMQVIGLGPHRLAADHRPGWFFDPARAAGILTDLAVHQIDQYLHFTRLQGGDQTVEVVAALSANRGHPEYPEFADYGEVLLRTPSTSGFLRVDWCSPDGLDTWGDVRLTLVGTKGSIEVRKNIDLAGRPGGDHLFLVDDAETQYIDCSGDGLDFAADLVSQGLSPIEQHHVFDVCELALAAEALASVAP